MSGISNVAKRNNALFHHTSGATNTAIGVSAMEANVDSSDNAAIGFAALRLSNLSGGNTAVVRLRCLTLPGAITLFWELMQATTPAQLVMLSVSVQTSQARTRTAVAI
jgi:hypothetical protein